MSVLAIFAPAVLCGSWFLGLLFTGATLGGPRVAFCFRVVCACEFYTSGTQPVLEESRIARSARVVCRLTLNRRIELSSLALCCLYRALSGIIVTFLVLSAGARRALIVCRLTLNRRKELSRRARCFLGLACRFRVVCCVLEESILARSAHAVFFCSWFHGLPKAGFARLGPRFACRFS